MDSAEIVTIGSEILSGRSVDTHSALLSRALQGAGLRVRLHTSVADDLEAMVEALKLALERSQLVVVTGGLGPTVDDLTREACARACGLELVEDPIALAQVEERFRSRGRIPTPNNRLQARLPKGAAILANPHGTAPGFRVDLPDQSLFALPGPPNELEPMLKEQVLPWLLAKRGRHSLERSLQVYGLAESAVDQALKGVVQPGAGEAYGLLAHPTHVEVILSSLQASAAEAEAGVAKLCTQALEMLGERVYALDGEGLEAVVGSLFTEQQATLAVAESCTGGRVAARLTSVPGSSAYFLGGHITYSNALKEKLLMVPPFVLRKAGAVSKDTALAMAVGLARSLGADYSLAVTGIAGPEGGTEEKPVGLVHVALATPKGVRHQEYRFGPDERRRIQARAAQAALWLAYCALAGIETPEQGSDRGVISA